MRTPITCSQTRARRLSIRPTGIQLHRQNTAMSDSEEGPSTGRKTGDTDPPASPSLSGKDLENLADLVVQKLQKRPTKDADPPPKKG